MLIEVYPCPRSESAKMKLPSTPRSWRKLQSVLPTTIIVSKDQPILGGCSAAHSAPDLSCKRCSCLLIKNLPELARLFVVQCGNCGFQMRLDRGSESLSWLASAARFLDGGRRELARKPPGALRVADQ